LWTVQEGWLWLCQVALCSQDLRSHSNLPGNVREC
jgi:hypothetical protein